MIARRTAALLLVGVLLAPPLAAFGEVTCGAPDDTATIQGALDAGGRVTLPAGDCRVTSLNLTGRRGLVLQGAGREATRLVPIQAGVNVLDLSGSGGITLRDFRVAGYGTAVTPATGILLAQTAAYGADAITIDHVRVDGSFSLAALYNLSVASSLIIGGQFYNYTANGLTVIFTGNNFFGAASQWQTITSAGAVPSDWTIVQSEFHNFGQGWALWLGGAQSFRMYGGNASSGHPVVSVNAVVVAGATVSPGWILFDGTTFYGDELSHVVPACAISGMASAATVRANQAPMPLTGC